MIGGGRCGWWQVGLLTLVLWIPARIVASTGDSPAIAAAALSARAPELGALLIDAQTLIDELLLEEEGEIAARGAVVLRVEACSPAARAGLEPADAIVELDGDAVAHTSDVLRILRERPRGARLPMTFVRDGQLQSGVLGVGAPTPPPRPKDPPAERCPGPLSLQQVNGR